MTDPAAVAAAVTNARTIRAAVLHHHATARVVTAHRAMSELMHPAFVDALTPHERAVARAAATLLRELADAVTARPAPATGPPLATVHPLRPPRDTPAHRV